MKWKENEKWRKKTKEPKIDTKSRKQSNLSVANEDRIIYDPLAHVQLMMFDKFLLCFFSTSPTRLSLRFGNSIFPPENRFSQHENPSKNVCNYICFHCLLIFIFILLSFVFFSSSFNQDNFTKRLTRSQIFRINKRQN